MAVVTTKASAISDRDSDPRALANSRLSKGQIFEGIGTLEAVSGDSIGSTYLFAQIPSNARISQVLLSSDAITTCAGDVGIYKSTDDGGTVVDADFFASAASLASAQANVDVTHESGVYGIDAVEKPLWQALGLTSDPGILYDLVVTLTAAAGSAGTISMAVRYVI